MRRTLSTAAILLALTGCEDEAAPLPPADPPPAGVPSATTAPATGTPIDASQATGVWNQQQVETWLRDMLKLTSVSLSKSGGDNYTGSGTAADGQSYQLTVKQVPGGIACRFTFGMNGSGRIAFGNPVND
jgi:hypothetical protein